MPYQKFTKDVGLIGLTNLLIGLEGLIILPIITKLLGPENYGIWAQIMVTLSLATPILTLGLPFTLIRFLAAEKNKKEIQEGIYSVLSVVFIAGAIASLFLIIFSNPISNFLGISNPILIKILALVILLDCLNLVFHGVLRAFQKIKTYSFFAIFKAFGEVGLIIGAISLGYGLLEAIIALLIVRLIIFLTLGGLIIKRIGLKLPNFSRIKEYLSFGMPTIASNISYWIIQLSDRYLIGYFWGVLYVGYYASAYAFGDIIIFFIAPLTFILLPVLSKFFDENKILAVKNYLKHSLKYFLMIAIPSTFGISILSKQLLTIFSTSEIALNAYFITPLVALSMLLYGISAIINQIIILLKKTKTAGIIWMGAALINLGLNFIFIPKFGILSAAITTLIAYTFGFILTWCYAFKDFRFEIDWEFILKSIFASILMTVFIIWFTPVGLLKTITAIILGAILYGILILLFKGFSKKEIEFLKEFFRKTSI